MSLHRGVVAGVGAGVAAVVAALAVAGTARAPASVGSCAAYAGLPAADGETAGMVFIPSGTFAMGSERHQPEERFVHSVRVDGFWIDRHEVTNAQFKQFVDATGHDLATLLLELTDGVGFDVVIEASGAAPAPAAATVGVRRGGRVLLVGLHAAPREIDLTRMIVREVDVFTSVAHICDSDIPAALELLAHERRA